MHNFIKISETVVRFLANSGNCNLNRCSGIHDLALTWRDVFPIDERIQKLILAKILLDINTAKKESGY